MLARTAAYFKKLALEEGQNRTMQLLPITKYCRQLRRQEMAGNQWIEHRIAADKKSGPKLVGNKSA